MYKQIKEGRSGDALLFYNVVRAFIEYLIVFAVILIELSENGVEL